MKRPKLLRWPLSVFGMKRWRTAILILVLVLLGGLYPYESTVVPAWKLRIVDEQERPYADVAATQAWKDYTLETEAGQNLDTRLTNKDGYVEFPERRIRASIVRRVFLTIFSAALTLAHGGFGIHAYVHASGPQGYRAVDYVPGKPPAGQLVLPSEP